MTRFSERMGLTSPKTQIQIESMDDDLRHRLWNVLSICYWEQILGRASTPVSSSHRGFFVTLWQDFFKESYDETENFRRDKTRNILRDYFFESEWYEVYNFIEFIANSYYSAYVNQDFM